MHYLQVVNQLRRNVFNLDLRKSDCSSTIILFCDLENQKIWDPEILCQKGIGLSYFASGDTIKGKKKYMVYNFIIILIHVHVRTVDSLLMDTYISES